MTTRLDKTLKRELTLEGRTFILAISPDGLKLTLKGRRKGQELRWGDLISGDAALAAALNASVGTFDRSESTPARKRSSPHEKPPSEKPAGAQKAAVRAGGAVEAGAGAKLAAAPGKVGRNAPARAKSTPPPRARRR